MSTRPRPDDCCATPVELGPFSQAERDPLVAGFKALGDPTRLEIYRLIAAQTESVCVCDIVDRFALSQPTISHHLKTLREAGLVTVSRRGVWAFYASDPAGAARLSEWIGRSARVLPIRFDRVG